MNIIKHVAVGLLSTLARIACKTQHDAVSPMMATKPGRQKGLHSLVHVNNSLNLVRTVTYVKLEVLEDETTN